MIKSPFDKCPKCRQGQKVTQHDSETWTMKLYKFCIEDNKSLGRIEGEETSKKTLRNKSDTLKKGFNFFFHFTFTLSARYKTVCQVVTK